MFKEIMDIAHKAIDNHVPCLVVICLLILCIRKMWNHIVESSNKK